MAVKMRSQANTSPRTEIVDQLNENFRKERVATAVFYFGIFSAIAFAMLRWLLGFPLLGGFFLCLWSGALIYYTGIFHLAWSVTWHELMRKISSERKFLRCLILASMPAVARLGAIVAFCIFQR